MKIIIDTHIFLWSLSEPDKLSPQHRQKIEDLSNRIFVSSVSIAEIAIKSSLGRLDISSFDPVDMIEKIGFEKLDFSAKEAMLLKDMPFHHKDPFDRMLIAQANAHGFYIMSDDSKFKKYECKLL